jgi:hypothetical protein
MGVVAIGLVLIVVRIITYRANAWLISANLLALALVIYGCGLVNVPYVIASYNVAHSRDIAGNGPPLDLTYLLSLGPQAIPAIDAYIAARPGSLTWLVVMRERDVLAKAHRVAMSDWRARSFRGWRLERYLEEEARRRAAADDATLR